MCGGVNNTVLQLNTLYSITVITKHSEEERKQRNKDKKVENKKGRNGGNKKERIRLTGLKISQRFQRYDTNLSNHTPSQIHVHLRPHTRALLQFLNDTVPIYWHQESAACCPSNCVLRVLTAVGILKGLNRLGSCIWGDMSLLRGWNWIYIYIYIYLCSYHQQMHFFITHIKC